MAKKRYIVSGTPRFARQSYNFRSVEKRVPRVNPYGWKNGQVKITIPIPKDPKQTQESNEKVKTASSQSVDRT